MVSFMSWKLIECHAVTQPWPLVRFSGSAPDTARIGAKFQIHFGPDNCAWLGLRGQHPRRSALQDIQMATKKAVVHPIDPFLFDGPSFQDFVFHLKSSSGAPNHTLTITSQTSVNTNFAFIRGTWQGDGPNAKNITGSVTDGTVSLTASWANGMGGTNTLIGRLTPASRIVAFPPRWELSGNVVVTLRPLEAILRRTR